VLWNGPLPTIASFTQSCHALNPLVIKNEEGTYLDVPRFFQVEKNGVVCHPEQQIQGIGIPRFPVDVHGYNVDALVAAVEKFKEIVLGVEEFNASYFQVEQYSVQGGKRVDEKGSAFPSRRDRVLM
jgi:hypothetical protein